MLSSVHVATNIEALHNRVGLETDNVFGDARLYVDQRCFYFQKPLLESGTIGTNNVLC